MRGQVVIAGIGHTRYGKLPGRTVTGLNVEASRNAIADAGIEKDLLDAVFVKYPTSEYRSMYGQTVAEALGLQPRIGGVWDQGGATNISMISFAAMSIVHGQCDVALVTTADNPKTGTRQAYERAWGDDASYGWFGTPAGYAQSRPVVDPFRRDDCCLISDGGAAVVVMSAKRARELGVVGAVPILGFGQGQTSWEVPQRPVLTETAAKISGATAFAMAGMTPKDIDVAQLYDCFTITPLMTLEDYGFCGKGDGGKFVEGGRIEIGGELPVNTSGGLLSETGMPGMQLVMEGVRQIRGTSANQVHGASTCIVSNQGGIMHTHSTLILGRS
jgi:acetyl-CoA acetyltransferase